MNESKCIANWRQNHLMKGVIARDFRAHYFAYTYKVYSMCYKVIYIYISISIFIGV